MYLSEHPAWSQRDLDRTEQDVLDHMELIRHEQAAKANREQQMAQHQQRAAEARKRH